VFNPHWVWCNHFASLYHIICYICWWRILSFLGYLPRKKPQFSCILTVARDSLKRLRCAARSLSAFRQFGDTRGRLWNCFDQDVYENHQIYVGFYQLFLWVMASIALCHKWPEVSNGKPYVLRLCACLRGLQPMLLGLNSHDRDFLAGNLATHTMWVPQLYE
jgi:hypothetical protein